MYMEEIGSEDGRDGRVSLYRLKMSTIEQRKIQRDKAEDKNREGDDNQGSMCGDKESKTDAQAEGAANSWRVPLYRIHVSIVLSCW
jgi:hypothetical protein